MPGSRDETFTLLWDRNWVAGYEWVAGYGWVAEVWNGELVCIVLYCCCYVFEWVGFLRLRISSSSSGSLPVWSVVCLSGAASAIAMFLCLV